MDGRTFRVEVGLVPLLTLPRPASLDVPVTLSLVAGCALLPRATIESLRVGDAVLPGTGWFDQRNPHASLVAVCPTDERGFRLSVTDAVRHVAGADLAHDRDGADFAPDDPDQQPEVGDALAVVRVEVGSITLSNRAWSSLQPGAVLDCGLPPPGPVVLRVAGQEVARGELVEVDGQFGVRIAQL
jgi:type III secretion system YscQ/HrcQ family protein